MQGIAAVLNEPMRGRSLVFGAPDVLGLVQGTPVYYGERRAGEVTRLWVEGALLHWTGRLDADVPALTWAADDVTIALPEPSPADLIAAGALVGVPAIVSAHVDARDGCSVLSGWSLHRMDLMRDRLWPEVTLRLVDGPAPVTEEGARAGAV